MLGDATLFTRADEVEEQWGLVDAIVAAWNRERPAFPNYAAGTWGPAAGGRAAAPRRPLLAPALIENATLRAIESELARLDAEGFEPGHYAQRTRVLTHVAWVPQEWEQAALAVLGGLGDRHPSRMIVLFPDPEAKRDALDAEVSVDCGSATAAVSVPSPPR